MVARRLLTPIELVPVRDAGPPTTGTWRIGTLVCDAAGNLWRCSVGGSPGGWVALGGGETVVGFTAGDLKPWPAASIPAGWLDCDGAAVSRTTYAALFAVIGPTWGAGDGSTTFTLPDLRRRTLVGAGGTGTATLAATVGSRGGTETHTLAVTEMPSHTHAAQVGRTTGSGGGAVPQQNLNNSTFSPLVATGGGGAHNNLQPSAVVRWLIKT